MQLKTTSNIKQHQWKAKRTIFRLLSVVQADSSLLSGPYTLYVLLSITLNKIYFIYSNRT